MGSTLQQDIRVRIDTLINGLPLIEKYSAALAKLKTGDSKQIAIADPKAAGDVAKLSGAINDLNKSISHIDEKQPGRLTNAIKLLSSVVQGLAAAGQAIDFVKEWVSRFDEIKSRGLAAFQTIRSGFARIAQGVGLAGHSLAEVGSELDRTANKAAQMGAQGTSGTNLFRAALSLLNGSAKQTGSSLAAVEGEAASLTTQLGTKVAGAIATVTGGLAGLDTGFGSALLLTGSLTAAFAALVAALALVAVGFSALVGLATIALSPLLKFGVDFNSKIEQTKLGIAAIVASIAELRDASGKKFEGPDALAQAFRLANDQVQKLKVDAINTVATFEQIAPALQTAIGPGLAAGLTLDQIRQTTVLIVQAAGAIGLPMAQVAQEVRAILEGSIDVNARLAKILGISNEMVEKWKQQGTLAEELNKRLEKFALAGIQAAETFEGLTSNLQEAFNVFAGEATTKAFNALKAKFIAILPQIFDFKNAGLQQSFKALASLIDGLFVRAIDLSADFIQRLIAGAQSVARFVQANRKAIDEILDKVFLIFRTVVGIALELGKILGNILTSRDAVALINTSLDATLTTIRLLGPALAPFIESLRFSLALVRAFNIHYEVLFGLIRKMGGGPDPDEGLVWKKFVPAGGDQATLSVPKTPGVGKGSGGGGGAAKKSRPEDTFESTFGFNKAAAESALALLKDSIERQTKLVAEAFEKRKLSLTDFYAESERLQRQDLNLTIESTKQAIVNARTRLANNVEKINRDPDLDAAEKLAKIAIETKTTETDIVGLNEKLIILLRDRAELAGKIADKEIEARRALQDSLQTVIDDIDRAKGLGPLVDARARIQELNTQIEVLRKNGEDFAADMLEKWVEVLGQMGQFYSRIEQGQRAQEVNEAKINTLREEGSRNFLTRIIAEQQINTIRKEQIVAAEALLQELLLIAETSTDPAILAAIEAQRGAVVRLKNEYKTVGSQIKNTFIDAVGGGLETLLLSMNGVIAGTKSMGDAFREFALGVILELQKIIIKLLVIKLMKAIFGGGSGEDDDSGGGDGGGLLGAVLPSIFGRHATGAMVSAHPGGRLIQVAEGGHDELVVSTDPSLARRTANLLGRFIKRTGILPTFDNFNSGAILGNISARIPSFGMGDFVPATPGGAFADAMPGNINVGGISMVFPNVKDARGFRLNEQAINREIGRAVESGIRKGRGTRD